MATSRWQAWKVGIFLPPPIGASSSIVLCKDQSQHYKGYMVATQQVVEELSPFIKISTTKFLENMAEGNSKKVVGVLKGN